MDTPSKERLVGAIIFVGLIVLVVPEILSGPHHFTSPGNTPAATPTRSYVIELGNPVKPAGSPGPEAKPTVPPPPAPGAQQLPVVTPPALAEPTEPATGVDPEPASAKSTAKATPANDDAGWAAQLGSFAKFENAQRLGAMVCIKG